MWAILVFSDFKNFPGGIFGRKYFEAWRQERRKLPKTVIVLVDAQDAPGDDFLDEPYGVQLEVKKNSYEFRRIFGEVFHWGIRRLWAKGIPAYKARRTWGIAKKDIKWLRG